MKKDPIWIGLLATITLFVIFIWQMLITSWPDKLNEQGDALSGYFSVLALTWLVISVYLQNREMADAINTLKEQNESARLDSAQRRLELIVRYLDGQLDQLQKIVKRMLNNTEKSADQNDLTKENVIKYLVNTTARLDRDIDKNSKTYNEFKRFSSTLKKDINRYVKKYDKLIMQKENDKYISEVHDILIADSNYEEIRNIIEKAKNKCTDELTQKYFNYE